MRLRILACPSGPIDGIALDAFRVGAVYDVRTPVACVFLAEGWAEVVTDADVSAFVHPPTTELAAVKPLMLVIEDALAASRTRIFDQLRHMLEQMRRQQFDPQPRRRAEDHIREELQDSRATTVQCPHA